MYACYLLSPFQLQNDRQQYPPLTLKSHCPPMYPYLPPEAIPKGGGQRSDAVKPVYACCLLPLFSYKMTA